MKNIFLLGLGILTTLIFSNVQAADWIPPTPVIRLAPGTVATGKAPFTVHVDAIASTPGEGSLLTAKIRWDFERIDGAADGAYRKLIGFNAAHTFDEPGDYIVKLTIKNDRGVIRFTTLPVTVTADNRSKIHVSADGNDSNPGTLASPIRSFARASQMITHNRSLLFRRGDTFMAYSPSDFLEVSTFKNVLIGAYGDSQQPKPILQYAANAPWSWAGFIKAQAAINLVVQDLDIRTFDATPHSPNPTNSSLPGSVSGTNIGGKNLTFRRCHFHHVGAVFSGHMQGLLAESNSVSTIGGYFVFSDSGSHTTILGNSVYDSIDQHIMRLYSDLILVHDNDFRNPGKTTISTAGAEWFYGDRNNLRVGRVRIGYDSGYFSGLNVVFDGNYLDHIESTSFEIYPSKNVFLRNNIIETNGYDAFGISGYDAQWQSNPSADNIWIANNTVINQGNTGTFARLGGNPASGKLVRFANNFYLQPELEWHPQGWFPSNVQLSSGTSLAGYRFYNNVWQRPAAGYDCAFRINGCTSINAWKALPEVNAETESLHQISPQELGENFEPPSNSVVDGAAAKVRGVQDGFLAQQRPTSQITIGAVQLP